MSFSNQEIQAHREFYDTAHAALLDFARSGQRRPNQDGHYLVGQVALVGKNGLEASQPSTGAFWLDDSSAENMLDYRRPSKAERLAAAGPINPEPEQRRLLEAGSTILKLTFSPHDDWQAQRPISYLACNPSQVNPRSQMGFLFYESAGHVPQIPHWPADSFLVMRSINTFYEIVQDIRREEQLQLVYEQLRSPQA